MKREHLSDYLVPLLAAAFSAAGIFLLWNLIGSPFVLAVAMHCLLFAPVMVSTRLLTPDANNVYFRIRAWEKHLYILIGVDAFRRLLGAVGWNRTVDTGRGYERNLATLPRLIRGTISSEIGHLTGCGMITVVILVAIEQHRLSLAAWLAIIAIPVQLYPVLIQRLVRAKIATWTFPGTDSSTPDTTAGCDETHEDLPQAPPPATA